MAEWGKQQRQTLDLGDFDMSPPSPHELEQSFVLIDKERIKNLAEALSDSLSLEHAARWLDISPEETNRLITDRQILAINLGHGLEFIPAWQFILQENGTYVQDPKITKLWDLWGREDDAIGFCQIMTVFEYRSTGVTPLQMLQDPNLSQAWLKDLECTMQARGTNLI